MHAVLGSRANWSVLIAVLFTACSVNNSYSGTGNSRSGSSATNTDAAGNDGSALSDQVNAQSPVCPGTTVPRCPSTIPSFSRQVTFIVQSRCSGCHSPSNDAGLWPLNDQESLSDWQNTILEVLRACTQPPPDSGVALTLSERQTFEAWLVCGASNN